MFVTHHKGINGSENPRGTKQQIALPSTTQARRWKRRPTLHPDSPQAPTYTPHLKHHETNSTFLCLHQSFIGYETEPLT